MKRFDRRHVRPLESAQNHFLEVLLSQFKLQRAGARSRLEVSFGMSTPACWNRAGREYVRSAIPSFREKAPQYQQILDAVLVHQTRDTFDFDDPDFVFRWASAGALPIVRLNGDDYYCFFYREIFPIGWNIANGACDTMEELLDPLRTLERELCEELIVLDPRRQDWYVLERETRDAPDRPEFAAVRLIVERLQKKKRWSIFNKLNQMDLPLKWFSGPDRVSIQGPRSHETVSDCYLNINASDFGIELDRVVKINASDDVVICDGEIADGRLLNRLVGLFRTDRLNSGLGQSAFTPDRFFYDGVPYAGSEFEELMASRFVGDIAEVRPPADVRAWEDAPVKFDLCPVTRRIVDRYSRTLVGIQEPAGQFDVFICFGGSDATLAGQVAHYLTESCGKSVFYYPEEQSDSMFHRVIDQALESCRCLVAVGSSREHLTRPWPEYEYRAFNVDIHSGRKPMGRLLTLVRGMDAKEVPLPLRSFHVIEVPSDAHGMDAALRTLSKYLN